MNGRPASKLDMIFPTAQGGKARLPDFRNLGVITRCVILAEGLNFMALYSQAPGLLSALSFMQGWGLVYEPTLFLTMLVLVAIGPRIFRLAYRVGVVVVVLIAVAVAVSLEGLLVPALTFNGGGNPAKAAVIAAGVASAVLFYFNWRSLVLSPSVEASRLAGLEARIRPHFLFNSLNTAVSVVRQDPLLAERILLDLSDLFRGVLAERRGMVPLSQEVELARAYGQIESLRLGERLRLAWEVDEAALGAQVPILVLQPLLENAVRYGVEPAPEGGEVVVKVALAGRMVVVEVINRLGLAVAPPGHGMALANIRERLALHFDAEARLRAGPEGEVFAVRLELPFRDSRWPGGARATDRVAQ